MKDKIVLNDCAVCACLIWMLMCLIGIQIREVTRSSHKTGASDLPLVSGIFTLSGHQANCRTYSQALL